MPTADIDNTMRQLAHSCETIEDIAAAFCMVFGVVPYTEIKMALGVDHDTV